MNYTLVSNAAETQGLSIYGGFHTGPDDGVPEASKTLLMLGPSSRYWPVFTQSSEWLGKVADPVDRWSERIVSALASDLGAVPFLPFGGPPYVPFLSWALKTKRCWSSPVGMLVHDTAGLFVSFRGALAFQEQLELPNVPANSPCEICPDKPCLTACPVDALSSAGYDVDACHVYLNSESGQDCLSRGCAARRACPVSDGSGRTDAQSAHHMQYFHR